MSTQNITIIPGRGCHCHRGPLFDFAGNGFDLHAFGWKGIMWLGGMATNARAIVDMTAGRLTIEDTCTGGEVVVRGVGEPIEDHSGGAVTIKTEGYLSVPGISNSVVPHIWASA